MVYIQQMVWGLMRACPDDKVVDMVRSVVKWMIQGLYQRKLSVSRGKNEIVVKGMVQKLDQLQLYVCTVDV